MTRANVAHARWAVRLRSVVCLAALCEFAHGQLPQLPQLPVANPPQQPVGPGGSQLDQLRPNYVLRPGDQILIRAFEMEEISERPFRVDGDGFIDLPVLGRVKAGGVTVEKLESTLVEMARKYVRQPQVTITVVQFSSEPVFFVGAFRSPGIYPLGGQRTLVEMMASVGGLQPTASRRITVTRRKEYGPIPLATAVTSPDGNGSMVEINMATLRANVNPAEDIVLQPFDVISVDRAEMVYVTGDVLRNGGFDLQEKDSMSVIQALAQAGGLSLTADGKKAWILRPIGSSSQRAQIPLNLKRILSGQDNDKVLLPNDVLYIPRGAFQGKTTSITTFLPLVTTALYIALYLAR